MKYIQAIGGATESPTLGKGDTIEEVSAVYQNTRFDNRHRYDLYFDTYNLGWKDDPDFSWPKGPHQGGPSLVVPPLGFQKPMPNFNPNPQNQQVDSLEETIKMLAQNTLQFQQSTIHS